MTAEEEVHACVQGMFDALMHLDADRAMSYMADTHCIWNVRAGDLSDPTIWKAGPFAQRFEMPDYVAKHKSYEVKFESLHTDIWQSPDGTKRTAIMVVKETGKSVLKDGKTHEWNGVVNLWSVVEIDGIWKITGSMHHIGEAI